MRGLLKNPCLYGGRMLSPYRGVILGIPGLPAPRGSPGLPPSPVVGNRSGRGSG